MSDSDHTPRDERSAIGWREWIALPELGVPEIKAKIDTGARSSALHVFDVEVVRRRGKHVVRFTVHPYQRDTRTTIVAEAELLEYRKVKSSGGHETVRPVILTDVELAGRRWPIELTLASRDTMGFRMLLGRQAIRDRFVVDPGHSFLTGKRKRNRKRGTRPGTSQPRRHGDTES